MADSIVKYTADGTTTDYSITFSYIARANVVVLVAGVVSTDFTFINDSTIQFNTAPALGSLVDVVIVDGRAASCVARDPTGSDIVLHRRRVVARDYHRTGFDVDG